MSTYAQVSDFTEYTTVTTTTPENQLQDLLDLAERDVDRIMPKVDDLTDMIEGISMSGVTGGVWVASVPFGITSYTSAEIPWNVDGWSLIGYLNEMQDPYGNYISYGGLNQSWFQQNLAPAQDPDYSEGDGDWDASANGSWIQPSGTYNDQYYAFGPLPTAPIVVEATGNIGNCRLPLLSIDTSLLEGTNPTVTVAQMVGGGLKVDPNQLSVSDQQALLRATCAQAEYRDQMGAEFFVVPQFKMVSGPEFNTQGRRPLIGPKVFTELQSTDLVQRGARAVVSTHANRQFAYMPIGTLGIPDDWRAI